MKEKQDIIPKSYPTNLINKDWNNRKLYWFYETGEKYIEFCEKVYEMDVKNDDVWIVTLPKCGTTWMQELVWLIMHDFDFEGAKNKPCRERIPFLELGLVCNQAIDVCLKSIEETNSPRFIKSHLPLPLLPAQLWEKKPKLIYVFRNPIDSIISQFYHSRNMGLYMDMTLEEYLSYFMEKQALRLSMFDHVAEFYELRNEPWIYYTSYERMKTNLEQVILDVCKFLNKNINETQMQQMLKHLSFEEMKKNPSTNHELDFITFRIAANISKYDTNNFYRKGKANVYKEELSKDFIPVMEKWVESNLTEKKLDLSELLLLNKNTN